MGLPSKPDRTLSDGFKAVSGRDFRESGDQDSDVAIRGKTGRADAQLITSEISHNQSLRGR